MKLKQLFLLFLCSFFSACSHVDQMANAERKEAGAIAKTDAAQQRIRAKTADYNRALAYAITLPPTPQAIHAETEILNLQYDLTGAAATAQAKLNQFVLDLIKNGAAAQRALAAEAQDNASLKNDLTAMTIDRDKARAVVNALANENAVAHDTLDSWIRRGWMVLAGFVAVLAVCVFLKFSSFAASVAAKAPL
jgi:hypothetical protein